MTCSKFSQDTLLEMLCYCSRDQLERHSIISWQLKCLIAQNFRSKPYRVFDRLDITCDDNEYSYTLHHQRTQWHPNQTEYTAQHFLDGNKCKQQVNALCPLPEMRPYLGESVRVKTAVLVVKEEAGLNRKLAAEIETVAHIWSDQELVILPITRYFTEAYRIKPYITDALIQQIANSGRIFQVRQLMISNPDFSFKDYSELYSAKILIVVYFLPFKCPENLLDFLQEPGAKPLVVLCFDFWKALTEASLFIDRIAQSFSSASTSSNFRLIIKYNNRDGSKLLNKFCIENRTTNEVLQLKNIDENEIVNNCGETFVNNTDRINSKYILVERSRL
ncbi:hypothetical protein DdX_21935 [Ditylenchus destructor]|uniref:Uncharacterized protein n=1 Tax=Ditylenchus destructor TaxID=166010 RepID=A0AAD4MGH8_9BILA|nr:hypothetical protein DdX_21935 [Ditylenchus destructor]